MKLYYIPGACSLAVDIALRHAGITPELVHYDAEKGVLEDGGLLTDVHAKGYVPVLIDEDGEVLTEVVSTLIEIGTRYPDANLLPTDGKARRHVIEWLAFTSAELHRQFVLPLFMDVPQTEEIKAARAKVEARLGLVADQMKDGRSFIVGDAPTVADIFLFVAMFWTTPAKVDLAQWPQMVAYRDRMMALPAVAEAMKAEGLA